MPIIEHPPQQLQLPPVAHLSRFPPRNILLVPIRGLSVGQPSFRQSRLPFPTCNNAMLYRPPHQYFTVYAVAVASVESPIKVAPVVVSAHSIAFTKPTPLAVMLTTQFALAVCAYGKVSVASVPVVVPVPVVSVSVPLTPSQV
uniref:Uncharacterized protein n=1 Tax=mine drainage metagenome TaxID=410659 RepID=E6QPH3_9ZZZZ